MPTPLPVFTLLAILILADSAVAVESASMQEKIGAVLRREHRFDPANAPVNPPETVSREDPPVRLPAYTVSDRRLLLAVERALRHQEKEIKEREYSLIRGGTIIEREIGRAKIELGTWALGPNLALVRISW
jgi:hypothetical protein